ncbi:MAG TPA: hypothetical protein VHU89_00055 [Acidobacteriaceae bacterium]|jgi:hypothetical protein|nr:hypothetical protein [Acidobacteriaceae bacterium]
MWHDAVDISIYIAEEFDMKVQRRGPATLEQVLSSIEALERTYGISTAEFESDPDPTTHVPEDEASRWIFLISQKNALQAVGDLRAVEEHEREGWTPNYGASQGRSGRLPVVDRDLVECGVAA